MEDIFNSFKEQFQDEELSLDDKINIIKQNDMEIESLIENTLKIPELFTNNCVTFNDSLFQDIELFTDHLNNEENSLFNKLNNTITYFGKIFLKNKLKTPIYNSETLDIQKNNITKFIPNTNDYLKNLNNIKDLEKDIMWFWKEVDEHLESIYDIIYFNHKYLKFFNYNEIFLLVMNFYKMFISPIMTCVSPVSSIIFLFIMYKYYRINIPFSDIILICKKNVYESI